MIKNPVFKVGDQVVYINDDMEMPRWMYADTMHLPVGCTLRLTRKHLSGWYAVRTYSNGTTMHTHEWFCPEYDIHPLYDDPYT